MSLPYLPLFIDDYEAATAHLSMLEDGAYNRLLRLCWRSPGCKLPNDEAWIMRKMRATQEAEQAAVKSVLSEFFTIGRGKIWSKRLLEVHLQKSVAHSSRSEAGKKGAAAKSLKTNKSDLSNAEAMLKQPEPEPEPEPEKKVLGGKPPKTPAREIVAILSEVVSEETASAFVDHRKSKRAPLTAQAARLIAEKLRGDPAAEDAINASIMNGWTGVFPDKAATAKTQQKKNDDMVRRAFASLNAEYGMPQ